MTIDEVIEQLERHGKLTIRGFGTFRVAERAAREGRNPRTGEAIHIPASRTVTFSASAALKDRLNTPIVEPKRMTGGGR
jgi:DNA-binding protein HU-beta